MQSGSKITRCAVYTRKSTEHGLDMRVTSLEAQRDVCQAYIKCQSHRNWVELPTPYDDGGYSGGSLERPALRRLISDVEAGRVDVIVIYKMDRLTRSLLDFVRLMDVLGRYGTSFVSVTQAFDTSDSMGRLILNILLTFAQFERELMSDRVRDKKAAMQRKGLFTGGLPPFGYLTEENGRLAVDPDRAPLVKEFFERYPLTSSVRELVDDMRARGCVTRQYVSKNGRVHGGQPITTAVFRRILKNPVYTGNVVHRGEWVRGDFQALITREQFAAAQDERLSRQTPSDPNTNYLLGILHDEHGRRMRMQTCGPGKSNPNRYYRSEHAGWSRKSATKRVLVNADRVEALAKGTLQAFLGNRKSLSTSILAAGFYSDDISQALKKGSSSSRRIDRMDKRELRQLFLALIPRAEVTASELRMYISTAELSRLLTWDGVGSFASLTRAANEREHVHLIVAPAFLIAGHPIFALPVAPCQIEKPAPDANLVKLLRHAEQVRALVHACRHKSIRELAKEQKIGEGMFARLLRVNYLAPDIMTAILDGTQPPGLTQRDVLYGPMPLDWAQQRAVLGFGTSLP